MKSPFAAGFRAGVFALALTGAIGGCGPRASSPAASAPPERPPDSRIPDRPPPRTLAGCGAPGFEAAAAANAATLNTLAWAPFRRPETGWETYAPLIGRDIGAPCPPYSPGFAHALAAWQAAHGLPGDGRLTEASFQRLQADWQQQRPYVLMGKTCPPPPDATELVAASAADAYAGKPLTLQPGVLAAYRRMIAAARADSAEIRVAPQALAIFSAYRAPEADAERCAREDNCDGVGRSVCSPHRTGLALDLFVGAAPGFSPDSSADPNRLYQSRTASYRWLVRNARRFGFVNYPFEPWHWEWAGASP